MSRAVVTCIDWNWADENIAAPLSLTPTVRVDFAGLAWVSLRRSRAAHRRDRGSADQRQHQLLAECLHHDSVVPPD